jgi:hypothetical protein
MTIGGADKELKCSIPTRTIANGIGEKKAWVRQESRQGENTLPEEGEPLRRSGRINAAVSTALSSVDFMNRRRLKTIRLGLLRNFLN